MYQSHVRAVSKLQTVARTEQRRSVRQYLADIQGFSYAVHIRVHLSLVMSLWPATGYAKPDGDSDTSCVRALTVEEFRALALEKSPLVAEIDSQYAREVALAYDTEVFRNPEVQFEQVYTRTKLGGDNDPQTNASLGIFLIVHSAGSRTTLTHRSHKDI